MTSVEMEMYDCGFAGGSPADGTFVRTAPPDTLFVPLCGRNFALRGCEERL